MKEVRYVWDEDTLSVKVLKDRLVYWTLGYGVLDEGVGWDLIIYLDTIHNYSLNMFESK